LGIREGKFGIHVIEDSHIRSEWDFQNHSSLAWNQTLPGQQWALKKTNPTQGILIHKVLYCEALVGFANQDNCQKTRSKSKSTLPHLHPNTHRTITRAASLRLHTTSAHPFIVLHALHYHINLSAPSTRVKRFFYQLLSVSRRRLRTEGLWRIIMKVCRQS